MSSNIILLSAENTPDAIDAFWDHVKNGKACGFINRDQIGSDLPFNPIQDLKSKIICLTSGSTGGAKAILRSSQSWIESFAVQRHLLHYSNDAPVIIIGSIEHSLHLFGAIEAVERGVSPAFLKIFSPKEFFKLAEAVKPALLYATPSQLDLLVEYGRAHDMSCESMCHILAGGAKVYDDRLIALRHVFPNADLIEFFGTSETSFIAFRDRQAPSDSVGKTCPGVDIAIRDDDGHPLAAGETGTLWIKSDMLFDDYIIGHDPQTRWHDGFVTIGDLGYLDHDGYLFYQGRKAAMVTIGGENVFLAPIEARLKNHIPNGEAVIIPMDDPLKGSRLIAAVQKPIPQLRKNEIIKVLIRDIGALKAPKDIIHIEDWPWLPSGKTDRVHIKRIIEAVS